jgi:hypothetical protein
VKRPRPVVALALAALALIGAGLGAYRAESGGSAGSSVEVCDDLAALFEGYCKPGLVGSNCATVTEEYADACQAGCVMGVCPTKVSCTGLDPIWCAPCDDMLGARFWNDTEASSFRCGEKLGIKQRRVGQDEMSACFKADMEQHCPALRGMNWHAKLQTALGR